MGRILGFGWMKVVVYLFFSLLFLLPFACGDATQKKHKVVEVTFSLAPEKLEESPNYASLRNNLDYFFTKKQKQGIFNGNVLIAKNGQVVLKRSYGYSDLERRKDPLEIDDVFQLASVTKQFTAAAILILKQRKQLDYDDLVTKYIPRFPYKDVTIKHLLTHRSGIPQYHYFSDTYWKDKDKPIHNSDVIDLLIRYAPVKYYKTDYRFDYNNTGYAVLASIIEAVSGQTYGEFLQENIFDPVGMKQTIAYVKGKNKVSDKVYGHHKNRARYNEDFQDGVIGDKGIFTTVDDMFKWDQALYTDKIIAPDIFKEALMPHGRLINGKGYGYGWRMVKLANGRYTNYHLGWWHGFRAYFVRVPNNEATVIILANMTHGTFFKIQELMDLIGAKGGVFPKLS